MDNSSVARPDARDAKTQRDAGLQALLARVEAATGPDRALDRATVEALGLEYVGGENPGWWDAPDPEKPYAGDWRNARLTASLDAALALVERVLPGHTWSVDGPAPHAIATIIRPGGTLRAGHLRGTTPPLALLAALLKALESQQPRDQQVAGDRSREEPLLNTSEVDEKR